MGFWGFESVEVKVAEVQGSDDLDLRLTLVSFDGFTTLGLTKGLKRLHSSFADFGGVFLGATRHSGDWLAKLRIPGFAESRIPVSRCHAASGVVRRSWGGKKPILEYIPGSLAR